MSDREEGEISEEGEIVEEGEIGEGEVIEDPKPGLKRAREHDEEDEGEIAAERRAQVDVTMRPETKYRSYNTHQADHLKSPFNRQTRAQPGERCEALDRAFSACIVEVGGEYFGTLDNRTSLYKLQREDCFSLPTLGVRVSERSSEHRLQYDETIASHLLEWDLNQVESAKVRLFRRDRHDDRELASELFHIVRKLRLGDRDAFNAEFRDGAVERLAFAHITIERSELDKVRARDYTVWDDSKGVNWCPANIAEHARHEPYRPKQPIHEPDLQRAMTLMKTASQVTLWVAITNREAANAVFDRYATLINEYIVQAGTKKPSTDV